MGKTREDWIDILRAVGILFMVMGHVEFGGVFDRYIHTFHMPVFFLISGYLYSSKKEIGLGKLLLSKVKRLLLPYVVYAIINYLFWLVLKIDTEVNPVEPLIRLVTYNTRKLPIAGALWFLTALFFAEVIYIILDRLIKISLVRTIVVFLISIAFSFEMNMTTFRLPLTIDIAFVCIGFYELGRLFKKAAEKYSLKEAKSVIVIPVGAGLLLVNAVLAFVNEYVNIKSGWFGIVPLFWFNAVLGSGAYYCFSIWFSNVSKETNIIKKFLIGIGKGSIIYLGLNQLVIEIVSTSYDVLGLPESYYVRASIILILTIAMLSLISFLIGKVKNKVVRAMFGL